MKFFIAIALLLLISSAQDYDYDAYMARFGKRWGTQEEYEQHKAIFQENMKKIEATNSKDLSYKVGQTIFTDLSQEQIQGRLHLEINRDGPFDEPPQRNLKVGVPVSVDWREEGMVTPVQDQGSCGSCWVFMTAAMYQSFLLLHGEPEYDLSEEYVLECTTEYFNNGYESSCAGGYVDFSIPMVHETGMPLEQDYPYIAGSYGSVAGYPNTTGICEPNTTIIKLNETNTTFNKYSDMSMVDFKDVVAFSPVGVLMYVQSGIYSYVEGVYSSCPDYNTSIANINHAVMVVGYTSDGHWIIKNSWGTAWGQNGYAIIDKDYDCGLSYRVYELRGQNDQLSSFNVYLLFSNILVLMFMIIF